MARFKIYSKDGQSVRHEGKPKYLGVYLNPSCLKFSEISSSEPIAWEVGDYVDYPRTGMRYRLYSIPQPSKEARRGSYGGAFRYSGVELYAATKELEIALFRDLVGNDNNIHFSTSPDVTTFENVYGIARRIQACMDYFYPGRWEIRIADFDADADAEILEKISTAKDFALSGATCLDALSKIYELWQDIGWIHSYENGKEVITIGYANKRIDANTTDSYLYGKGNGLTAIKKNQTNKDEFATRLYVYGSERNLPARYYNDKEILNAASVDIRNLMLPLDSWGKTNGLPDARKAYLENAEAVAKFGVIPKTHYFDSEDAGADIHPTIERLTIGEIRSVMQSTDEYYPTDRYADGDRADAVLDAINPTDDGVLKRDGKEYDAISYVGLQSVDKKVHVTGGLNNAPIIINHPLFSKVVDTDFSKGKVVADLSQTITIPDRGYTSVSARVDIEDSEEVGYGASHGYADFVATKSDDGKNWIIKLGRVSVDYSKTIYDTHKFPVYGFVTIDANTVGAESGEITIKFGPGSGSVSIKRVLDKTFIAYLKQIGFNINTQASLGKGKTISMKTGACAGRNFVISDCLYSPTLDAWLITCKRQQDDTLGMLFPNSSYEIAEGDTFVLLDIAMPELYVSVAQNRLLAEGRKLLSRASKIQSNYEPSIDAKVMIESGRTIREGMFMEITDEDVIDNTTDYILIDTLSISEDESAIPTYKVTLRERRKVTYKGTPSATSATETKSVEDETEVQPNVDLTGYAKETYVDDKVSEVNNILASMWTIDEETGNLVTDRNVRIAKNVIIGGDMSSAAKGRDAGAAGGIIGVKVGDAEYTDISDGILDMTEAFEGLNVDVDLSDYYTSEETDAKIAESLIPYAKIADIASTYATKESLATLQTEVDNIEAILGMDEEAEGIINTWNEVKAFLDGYSSSDDLAAILSTMNADIAKRALDSDLDTLAGRVGVNELAIADNAGNIKKNFDAIGVLESNKANWGTTLAHYGITDAYTKVNVDDLLKKYLLLEAESQTIKGNLKIEGNLIIAGDMSSEGTGGNSGADGTVIGVVVNGTQYADETNGMLDLSTLMNQYVTNEWITSQRFVTTSHLASTIGPLSGRVDTLEKAGYITSSALNGYATQSWVEGKGYITGISSSMIASALGSVNNGGKVLSSTGGGLGWISLPTSLPASDVYAWAKKSSLALADVPDLSSRYLSTAGGTISGGFGAMSIKRTSAYASGIKYENNNGVLGYLGFNGSEPYFWDANQSNAKALIHSGNIGSYNAGSAWGLRINEIANVNDSITQSFFMAGFQAANRPDTSQNYSTGITLHNNTLGYTYQLAYSTSNALYSRRKTGTGWGGWKQLAFTDSDITGSAARLKSPSGFDYANADGSAVNFGYMTSQAAINTYLEGYNLYLRYGTGHTTGITLNSSGNVLIGTTTDWGYKLDVFSDNFSCLRLARNKGAGYGAVILSQNNANTLGIFGWNQEDDFLINAGGINTQTGNILFRASSTGIQLNAATKINGSALIYKGSSNAAFTHITNETATIDYSHIFVSNEDKSRKDRPLILQNGYGNVLIGTTTNSGYKLDVNGTARVGHNAAGGSLLTFNMDRPWTFYQQNSGSGSNLALIASSQNKAFFIQNSASQNLIGFYAYDTPYVNIISRAVLDKTLDVAGAVTMSSTLSVGGNTTINGNLIVAGDTSSGSDIRFKDKLSDHRIALSDIAEAPLFTFRWNDREDDSVHLGSSAQYWEKVAPWLVKGEDFKTLDYSTLGVAIGISLANKTLNLEDRVKILEDKVKALEAENRRLRYGS